MFTMKRIGLFLSGILIVMFLAWPGGLPSVPLSRPAVHAADFYAQRGPTNAVRPVMTAWQLEQRDAALGWVATPPENLLSHASGAISVNSQNIANLADPTTNQHAATKAYVDNVATVTGALSLTNGVIGLQGGRPRLRSSTGATLVVEGLGTVAFRDQGGSHILCAGAPCYRFKSIPTPVTFSTTSASASCPTCTGGLTANGRYYLYVYSTTNYPTAPNMVFEVSATAPDSNLINKNGGDQSRIYVGTLRMDNSGFALYPFQSSSGFYQYPTAILTTFTAATGFTNLELTGTPPLSSGANAIPPHARTAYLHFDYTPTSTGNTLAFSTDGTCSNADYRGGGGAAFQHAFGYVALALLSGGICYRVSNGLDTLSMYVSGFQE